ncbi:MAG: family 43 glycosylhydrolase [Spirochaetales bacterium]|nr:family 43 glycosylhydrolase [Spirochaetales bacterium]
MLRPRIISLTGVLALCAIFSGCLQMRQTDLSDGTEDAGSEDLSWAAPDLLNGHSRNPIISHVFTADPTARVFENRVYVYASRDLDAQTGYDMTDYHIFSSDDLVNWQDHGVGLDAADIPWASRLYAPDCVYSPAQDKYFLFFPNGASNIGVAVSDRPEGPFKDAIGGPLVTRSYPGCDVPWLFDPGVLMDDDGQAYLYFGGGMPGTGDNARVIRLNDDLIGLKDSRATVIEAPDFFEAAFPYKRGATYYFTYSTHWENGHGIRIDYMTSDNPMSGFAYRGTVIDNPPYNDGNNNHHSIVDYMGRTYVFYHSRRLAHRLGISGGYQRSITLDYLEFGPDGEIVQGNMTEGTVEQLKNVDGAGIIQAELMAAQHGVEVGSVMSSGEKTGACLTDLDHGDWTAVSRVDFGGGVSLFTARVSAGKGAGTIELWIDGGRDNGGTLLGVCEIEAGSGDGSWTDAGAEISPVSGVHDLYFVFKGEKSGPLSFDVDHYRFE